MPSGTAVSASAALCSVSPSSATEPETATTAAWSSRRAAEHGQRDPQRPDALGAGLHRRIHLAGGIVGMRAQHMPKPLDHSWPAGMNMAVGVIRAVASLPIAHNAQNARRTRLQHINNNHPDATAKDPQHIIFSAALQMSWPVIGRLRISRGRLQRPAWAAVPVSRQPALHGAGGGSRCRPGR